MSELPESASEAREPGTATLPEWDLSDLYGGLDDAAIESDLARAAEDAKRFRTRYRGRIQDLDGPALGAAIAEYEAIEERLGRLLSFAYLYWCTRLDDEAAAGFYQTLNERATEISSGLLFLTLELNRIDEQVLAGRLEAPALARYRPWIRDVRDFAPHQLADDMERLLHEKHVTGRAAWVRLFDETVAGLRFQVGGRELNCAQALHLLTDKDREVRRQAAKEIGRVFGARVRLFALITNTLAKDKAIEDAWRHFPRPISSRNLGNHVEDEVVDALIAAVRDAYPALSHRYYRIKAGWLGLEQLEHWDRNAPLPEDEDRLYPWERAQQIVLDAYARFSPEMAAIARRFFERGWIDAPIRPAKAPGAFAHPTVPSAHPYVLLNYQAKARDVMTLAHELGHGVHQVLAAPQGALMADTPLTLAETASVFGEQLAFRALLDAEDDPARRRVLIAAKVEDMLNTVVRQIAFCEFERRLHDERHKGEIPVRRIGEIWLAVQAESLGPAFRFADEYRFYWTYVPHFVHSPFYVYAYAFGECLVNALYALYEQGAPGFEARYLEMLRAGGTLRHHELLAPFGLDARERAFWATGLGVISRLIDTLEAGG